MISTDSSLPENGNGDAGHDATAAASEPADRVGTLRGAGVGTIDTRRLGRIVVGLILATLAVLVVVFTVVGVHKNQQADRLRDDGVPVTFTISACTGLLGGSGSNFAGYVCHGAYRLDGHAYSEQLPGNDFHRPGATVPAVAVPGDPALVSPAAMVRTEHSSAGVFIVPAILLVVLLGLVGLVLLRRRKQSGAKQSGTAAAAGR